ncbi:TIGR03752 family integrating conjugative element protein, partial [Pseudomonas sp. Pseusp122]
QEQLSGLTGKDKDMPIGLGLESGDGAQLEGPHTANDALQWIEPSDAPTTDARGKTKSVSPLSLPSTFNSLEGLKDNAID